AEEHAGVAELRRGQAQRGDRETRDHRAKQEPRRARAQSICLRMNVGISRSLRSSSGRAVEGRGLADGTALPAAATPGVTGRGARAAGSSGMTGVPPELARLPMTGGCDAARRLKPVAITV